MAGVLRRMGGILFSLALVLGLASALAEPNFPALTGRVVDDAKLLSAADEQALTADLEALEKKSSDQVVVVTVPSLQGDAIEDYGYQLGRHWGIGTKQLNNGMLLIIALEVGRVQPPAMLILLKTRTIPGVLLAPSASNLLRPVFRSN